MNRFAAPPLAAFALATVAALCAAPVQAQTPEPGQPAPPPPTEPGQPAPPPQTPQPTAPGQPAPRTLGQPDPPPANPQPAPPEEEKPRRRGTIGPEVGFYFPINSTTRDAFGSTWVNYGLGFRPISLASRKGLLGFDLNIISTTGTGRRALLIPANIIYKRAIGGGSTPGVGITPYAGVATGLLIADLRSDNYNVHSGFRGGFGGTFLLGVTVDTKFFVEARYQAFSKIKGFNLSGIGLSTGIRF